MDNAMQAAIIIHFPLSIIHYFSLILEDFYNHFISKQF